MLDIGLSFVANVLSAEPVHLTANKETCFWVGPDFSYSRDLKKGFRLRDVSFSLSHLIDGFPLLIDL